MDIEKLKALKTAVEIGSITQAAEHMGYSQPGLTGMLKRLEQEVGYPLLRRGSGGVRLTDEGRALMPYIERILRESDTFEHAVRALRPAQQDELRIGSYTSISKNWLPQVIRGFSRKYPGVRPCISTIATQDSAVIKMVEQGMGCSILSELVLRGNTDHVSLAPLDPPAWRQLGAGVKSLKAIGRVTKNFLNYIQNGKAQKRPRRSFRRGRFIYACSRLRSQRLGSPAHGITAATRPTTCAACTGAVSGALFASPCVCRTVPSPVCCICTIR